MQMGMDIILCASKTVLLLVYIPVFQFHEDRFSLSLYAPNVFFYFPDTASMGKIYVDSTEPDQIKL